MAKARQEVREAGWVSSFELHLPVDGEVFDEIGNPGRDVVCGKFKQKDVE